MQINDFLENINGDLRAYNSKVLPLFQKVVKQAIRHTTRSEMSELHDIARPAEDEAFTQWRKDNRRHLTPDFINQFVRMLQRILASTLKLDYDYEGLERFIFQSIIPLAIQDPNAVVLHWPFIQGVDGPPNLNGDNTTKLSTRQIIVYSLSIKEIKDTFIIYNYDEVEINKAKYQRYVGIDEQNYYLLEPYLNDKKQVKYRADIWYIHGMGFLPIAKLPGINTNTYENGIPTSYKESLAWPAFENFDEGVIRLSSEQVASIKHANPKLILNGDIKCPGCGGEKYVYDENKKASPCKSCAGTGSLTALGDFSTVKIQNGKGEFDKSHDNPLYYLEPPQGLEYLRKSWKEFFEDGKKALCNDLLEHTGTESGIAKELRLEPKQDLMKSFGQAICWFIEDLVNQKRILEGNSEIVKVTPPAYYQTKSPDVMKMDITLALPGERYMKFIDYIDTVFKGDEIQIKVHKFAVLYAPLMLYKPEEIDTVFNAGAYSDRDIQKRDLAIYAMNEIVKANDKIQIKEAKDAADALLTEQGFLNEEATFVNANIDSVNE